MDDNNLDQERAQMFSRIDNFVNNMGQNNSASKTYQSFTDARNIRRAYDNQTFTTTTQLGMLAKAFEEEDKASNVSKDRYRLYNDIKRSVNNRMKSGGYGDLVTRERVRVAGDKQQKLPNEIIADENFNSDTDDTDEEMHRMDFAESILLNPSDSAIGHNYWNVLKLFRYLRITNSKGSLVCLLALRERQFRSNEVVRAFEDGDGAALILNLLAADDITVRVAAMSVLHKLTNIAYFTRVITFMGGIPSLVDNLTEPDSEVRRFAALLLGDLCIFKQARTKLREAKGIEYLLCILDEVTDKFMAQNNEKKNHIKQTIQSMPSPRSSKPYVCPRISFPAIYSTSNNEDINLLAPVASALWKASRSQQNRDLMRQAGMIGVLSKLIHTTHPEILVPLTALLYECAVDKQYRIAIATEGMLPVLLSHIKLSNICLKTQCAMTLLRCAKEDKVRKYFCNGNGLQILYNYLNKEVNDNSGALALILSRMSKAQYLDEKNFIDAYMPINQQEKSAPKQESKQRRPRFSMTLEPQADQDIPVFVTRSTESPKVHSTNIKEHIEFLASLTGSISKLCNTESNAVLLHSYGTTNLLLKLMTYLPMSVCAYLRPACSASERLNGLDWIETIVTQTAQGLSHLAKIKEARDMIIEHPNGVKPLILILRMGPYRLVPPVCDTLTSLMSDPRCLAQFHYYGGIRLLVSLASNKQRDLRIAALKTLYSCIKENPSNSRLLKPLVGFMRNMVELLREYCNDEETLQHAARVIAEMARDLNCLAIMTDLGILSHLERMIALADTDELRASVAAAVASCAVFYHNVHILGRSKNIYALVEFMKSTNEDTLSETVKALSALSQDKQVAHRINQVGINSVLLKMISSADSQLQMAAAVAIRNISRLNKLDGNLKTKILQEQQLNINRKMDE